MQGSLCEGKIKDVVIMEEVYTLDDIEEDLKLDPPCVRANSIAHDFIKEMLREGTWILREGEECFIDGIFENKSEYINLPKRIASETMSYLKNLKKKD